MKEQVGPYNKQCKYCRYQKCLKAGPFRMNVSNIYRTKVLNTVMIIKLVMSCPKLEMTIQHI